MNQTLTVMNLGFVALMLAGWASSTAGNTEIPNVNITPSIDGIRVDEGREVDGEPFGFIAALEGGGLRGYDGTGFVPSSQTHSRSYFSAQTSRRDRLPSRRTACDKCLWIRVNYTVLINQTGKDLDAVINQTALIASALTLALTKTAANAQSPYAGAAVGLSGYNISDVKKDKSLSFRAVGGYRFTDNLALEAAYINFGHSELKGVSSIKANITALSINGVGITTINESVSLFAKAGFHSWDAELTTHGVKADDDGVDFNVGLGAQFYAAQQVNLIVELEHYKVASDAINNASIGVRVHF